jgi:hypothetical protein
MTSSLTLPSDKTAAAFAHAFVAEYLQPAFGARAKTEVDHLVFRLLVEAKAIDPSAAPFELARLLNVPLTRAKSLVLNWQLRQGAVVTVLRERLVEFLRRIRYHKDGEYIAVGIGDVMVREYFIAALQSLGTYPDRSFADELVRVPIDGFVAYIDGNTDKDKRDAIEKALVKAKLVPDTSLAGITKAIVKAAAVKIGEKALGNVAEGAVGQLGKYVKSLFGGRESDAVAAARKLFA